ncbi:MAG: hypothetical protein IJV74_04000 [Clostridia bacterium]|nr:hypothetical protein [Oscillospiraceae bacterium]MBQ9733380.1 hypothetical protein [Clostridia bacterium]
MKRAELDALKENIAEKKTKASDLDVIVEQIMKLPYGQLKKVLTDEVMAVLAKYGYTE